MGFLHLFESHVRRIHHTERKWRPRFCRRSKVKVVYSRREISPPEAYMFVQYNAIWPSHSLVANIPGTKQSAIQIRRGTRFLLSSLVPYEIGWVLAGMAGRTKTRHFQGRDQDALLSLRTEVSVAQVPALICIGNDHNADFGDWTALPRQQPASCTMQCVLICCITINNVAGNISRRILRILSLKKKGTPRIFVAICSSIIVVFATSPHHPCLGAAHDKI